MITLNTAMAHTLTCFRNRVDDLVAQGISLESAILKIVREDIKYTRPIRFDGNGYSNEWLEEASLRGLDCETSCPLIYDRYLDDASVEMFESMKVMTKYELQARNEIKWDIYTKKVQIEARVFGDLCLNHIIPVVTRYQSVLIDNVRKVMDIFPAEKARQVSANNITLIEKISEHESYIVENVKRLIDARKVANRIASERDKAIAYHDTVAPMLEDIRLHIDQLELVVDNELWTLPKYRELLFIV
jgi:glutamine synthetase